MQGTDMVTLWVSQIVLAVVKDCLWKWGGRGEKDKAKK